MFSSLQISPGVSNCGHVSYTQRSTLLTTECFKIPVYSARGNLCFSMNVIVIPRCLFVCFVIYSSSLTRPWWLRLCSWPQVPVVVVQRFWSARLLRAPSSYVHSNTSSGCSERCSWNHVWDHYGWNHTRDWKMERKCVDRSELEDVVGAVEVKAARPYLTLTWRNTENAWVVSVFADNLKRAMFDMSITQQKSMTGSF